jgi:hypothetical protein
MNFFQWLLTALFGAAGAAVAAAPKGEGARQGTAAATGPRVVRGDGTWGWIVEVDGPDLVIRDAVGSWFGGDNDPQDNGETASGVLTKGHPEIVGFALPMDFGPKVPSTQGSPIPRLPWYTPITVSLAGVSVDGPLIDLGPAKSAKHQVDMTQAAFKHFGHLDDGIVRGLTVRIHNGAKYVV